MEVVGNPDAHRGDGGRVESRFGNMQWVHVWFVEHSLRPAGLHQRCAALGTVIGRVIDHNAVLCMLWLRTISREVEGQSTEYRIL